jgi:hypothetical protein
MLKNLMREWGFPVGLLTLWVVAAAYTLHSLVGMQSSQVPVMVLPPMVIEAPSAAHGS